MKQSVSVGVFSAVALAVLAGCSEQPAMSAGTAVTGTAAGAGVPTATAGARAGAGAGTAAAGSTASAGRAAAGAGLAAGGVTGISTAGAGAAAGAGAGAGGAAGAGAAGNAAGAGGAAGATVAGAGGATGGSAGATAAGTGGSTATAGGGAAGCGSESFAAIYQSIFMNPTYSCAGALCHGRDAANAASVGNLSMSSVAVAYMQLVSKQSDSATCSGKTRVVPHDPMNSLLVQKLRGQNTTCGAPMPVNADEITDTELKRITDWISAGACNN